MDVGQDKDAPKKVIVPQADAHEGAVDRLSREREVAPTTAGDAGTRDITDTPEMKTRGIHLVAAIKGGDIETVKLSYEALVDELRDTAQKAYGTKTENLPGTQINQNNHYFEQLGARGTNEGLIIRAGIRNLILHRPGQPEIEIKPQGVDYENPDHLLAAPEAKVYNYISKAEIAGADADSALRSIQHVDPNDAQYTDRVARELAFEMLNGLPMLANGKKYQRPHDIQLDNLQACFQSVYNEHFTKGMFFGDAAMQDLARSAFLYAKQTEDQQSGAAQAEDIAAGHGGILLRNPINAFSLKPEQPDANGRREWNLTLTLSNDQNLVPHTFSLQDPQ